MPETPGTPGRRGRLNRHVLLADDDRDFADGLAALLRFEGYHVTIANTSVAAIETVAADPPHVALIDLRLGHASGIDLVHELLMRQPKLVAVILTAYASLETSIEAMHAGAYDYLCKPFYINDLLATLERCFERRRLTEEREQALTALARSEERLRRIVENSPSAISFEDLDGNEMLANERFRQLFAAASGHRIAAGLPDESVIRTGRVASGEIEIPHGDEIRRVLVARFPVFDENGTPVGIGTIGTDVTERHQAEERLRQVQRMEAIGRLTGGIAHDFNNLLTVVLGNLRLIEEDVRNWPDLRELVTDALDATLSGVELTVRLLAVGQNQPLQPEVTDVAGLLRIVSRLLRRVLGETIEIKLDIAPDLWRVRIDRGQLESSLLNLAINGRDAMPNGGQLMLTAHNMQMDSGNGFADTDPPPDRCVVLSVRDTGVGMPAEIREQAIQPFFTTKHISQGSGLGLSMVHGFVRQSGGRLEIVSAPGEGTEVTIYLPVTDGTSGSTNHSPLDVPVQPNHGEHILIVEDQPQIRQFLRRQLQRLGYRVQEAAEAEEALQYFDAIPPIDLLLTDIVLPGRMSGLELGGAALVRKPGLALVFITGHAPEALAGQSDKLRHVAVLRKPIEPAALAKAVRQALDQAAART
ncbi:response regulator [Acidiphilium iwatense]|uniref:histidine kinase n=1 Tax=Acidiphilium iwatense TaxID=768198 RepID=A0ABS9E2T2_9PROT|nr:response regulator [Acidiphilium iwatense]MCF3948695.1 response regulator [Acidiphilium iwatense]